VEAWKDTDLAEMIVEGLGRVALARDSWREMLRSCGALELAAQIISSVDGHPKLIKYSFWFAASISGVPWVVQQLMHNQRTWAVVDAAFCTIIDILDEDVEGEWVLSHARQSAGFDVAAVLALIAEVVVQHSNNAILQGRGCHCLGLLAPMVPRSLVPLDKDPREWPQGKAVVAICVVARRHRFSAEVARDSCYAFRSLLRFERGEADPAVVVQLMQEDVEEITQQALVNFASEEQVGLLEDAVFVLAAVSGIDVALKAMHNSGQGPVRRSGVKALFEFCQLIQITPELAQRTGEAVVAMVQESQEDPSLSQNAELLKGLCEAEIRRQVHGHGVT